MRNLFPALPVSFGGVFWVANKEWLQVCNVFIIWLYHLTQYTYKCLLPKIQLIRARFGLCIQDPLLEKPDMTDGKQQKIFSDISLSLIAAELSRIIQLHFKSICAEVTEIQANRWRGSENAQNGNFLIRAFGTDNGCKQYKQRGPMIIGWKV